MIGYLGLGSNLGARREQLQDALDALPLRVLASSCTYDTDPVGEVLDQPTFLNASLQIETELEPESVLDVCKRTERELGRMAGEERHAAREIDIDLLLLGTLEHCSDRLTLPHKQVLARRFVLIPLLELDFELCTPAGERLSEALARLEPDEGVRLAGAPLTVR